MRTYYKQKSKFSITSIFFLTNWILSHYFLLIFCFICIFLYYALDWNSHCLETQLNFREKWKSWYNLPSSFERMMLTIEIIEAWGLSQNCFYLFFFILFMPKLNSIYLVFKVFYHYYIKRCYVCFKRECYMKFIYYFIIS